MFPEHHTYVEPFGGMGWVLLGKTPSPVEVFNDIEEEIANLYNVIKYAHTELIVEMQYTLYSRKTFEEYKAAMLNKSVTGVQRAAYYPYIVKTSFASMGRTWGYARKNKPKMLIENVEKAIKEVHARLQRVYIEYSDYRPLIPRYDSPETLFFLDPPYRTRTSKNYPYSFGDDGYIEMRDILRTIKGKFLLTLNDDAFIRQLFKEFHQEEVMVNYSLSNKGTKKFPELIIRNY
jgi:DNA adenine methylase